MAPLSILPGRVRFADGRLIGNEALSRHLETGACLAGISQVSASHRTGRILVEFDEQVVDRAAIARHITVMLGNGRTIPETVGRATPGPVPDREAVFVPRRLLADVALHLLLPAPFDLLVPVFRRG